MALSDILRPAICELGKVKIGGLGEARKGAGGTDYRLPKKLDHFRIVSLNRDAQGDLAEDKVLMDSLAKLADSDGKLRQLPIVLLSNDINEVLQASWVWYSGKRCAARSDGVPCLTLKILLSAPALRCSQTLFGSSNTSSSTSHIEKASR